MVFSRHILLKLSLILLSSVMLGCSSFELTSWPQAEVYENGEKIGTTPYRFTMVSGSRDFTLKRYCYVDRDVSITAVDAKQQHFKLQWIGRTTVDSLPSGATVVRLEDNQVLDATPCGLLLSHPVDVVLKLEGFEDAECTLTPNREHVIELKPRDGFKPTFYRDIYFSSSQGAVAIYDRIAGKKIGVTPVRLKVEAGSELEYRLPGHISEQVLISRNAPGRIDIALKPLMQVVMFGPPGALVYRADETTSIGEVPLVVQVDGPQTYELKMEGYYDRTVTVSPDSPPRITVDLKEIPYKTIVSDPTGGEVYRLGGLEKLGTTPFTTIVENECAFEIRKEGYKPHVIGVGPSSPRQLKVPLSPVPEDEPDTTAIGGFGNSVLDTF